MFSPEQKRILEMLEIESKADVEFMRKAQEIILNVTMYRLEAALEQKDQNEGLRFKATRNADGGLVLKKKEITNG